MVESSAATGQAGIGERGEFMNNLGGWRPQACPPEEHFQKVEMKHGLLHLRD